MSGHPANFFRSAAWGPIGLRTLPAVRQFDARPVIQYQSRIWGPVMPEGPQVHGRRFRWLGKNAESWRLPLVRRRKNSTVARTRSWACARRSCGCRQERDAQTETVDLEAENERLRTARATHEKSRHADSCWVGFAPTREKHLSTAH